MKWTQEQDSYYMDLENYCISIIDSNSAEIILELKEARVDDKVWMGFIKKHIDIGCCPKKYPDVLAQKMDDYIEWAKAGNGLWLDFV